MVKGIFIHSALNFIWNSFTNKTISTFCRLLCILYIGSIISVCQAACPTNNLTEVALGCFENYGTQKINLDKSNRRLFSGIDVETLRAYCSSFLQGMSCLTRLSNECPESMRADIEIGLNPLNGVEQELSQLCRTDSLYEIYAIYMTCFMDTGQKSDWCFKARLSDRRQSVYVIPENQLCSRMRTTIECIESNVKFQCGVQATELVHKLVMPLVRGSGRCVYSIQNKETTSKQIPTTARKGGTYQTAGQEKRGISQDNNDRNSSLSTYHVNTFVMIILFNFSYLFKREVYS